MLCVDGLPLSFGDKSGFRNFCKMLEPRWKIRFHFKIKGFIVNYIYNIIIFNNIIYIIKKYLSAPPTSAESERLFSSAGYIVNKYRGLLSHENLEMLLFLNKNLELYNFDY